MSEYSNEGNRDKLCLVGGLAQDYMRTGIGETVKLTVTAVLKCASIQAPENSEEEEMPYVEFEVLEVDGGKKPYSEMSPGEMDQEIYNVKSEDQPEPTEETKMYREGKLAGEPAYPSTIPNREDGGSIWTDVKRQEKVNRKPFRRVRPFGMR